MINITKKEKEKISRKLNEVLIERIRKCQTQNTSQLINSPNDEDTNKSFLGGLLFFDGDKNQILDYEKNIDLDNIAINKIYIAPFKYNEYEDMNDEEEEEGKEGETGKIKNNTKIKKKSKKLYDLEKDDEKSSENNIKILIDQDFNQYLDLIQKNYRKFENNHFPKLIDKNNKKNINNSNIRLKNKKSQIYETKKGEKIIINDEVYSTSIAYLKNRDLFYTIPQRYQKNESEFSIDYTLLEEKMENILIKSQEFINMNSKLSTSMSKVLLYSNYLDKYINDKLEPFNYSINTSFEKINRDKKLIPEMKVKMMKNSGNIILRRLKMDNSRNLIKILKRYQNLKNIMNSIELLLSEPQNSQERYDMINKCKEEIENIKIINNNEKNSDSIIELFEQKLSEYKSKNDAHMYGKLSQVLNNYFNNFLFIENEISLNKKEKLEEYEKYGISKFVLEKVCSTEKIYENMLISLYFSSPKEEQEKISKICEYYIEGNLMNNIYMQLRGIFIALTEQCIDYIITIFREKITNNNNNNNNTINKEKEEKKEEGKEKEKEKENNSIKNEKEEENKGSENININNKNEKDDTKKINDNNNKEKEKEITENEKKENKGEEDSNKDINYNDEIFILLCILLSKNKFIEIIMSFIDVILTKVKNGTIIDKVLKGNIIKEIKEIKIVIQENIKNLIREQIKQCLHKIAL